MNVVFANDTRYFRRICQFADQLTFWVDDCDHFATILNDNTVKMEEHLPFVDDILFVSAANDCEVLLH